MLSAGTTEKSPDESGETVVIENCSQARVEIGRAHV